MNLEDLVGKHKLSAVDIGVVKLSKNVWAEECQSISFTLDGITYTAIEDPDDGYRSMMRELKKTDNILKNQFPSIEVLARMIKSSRGYKSEILKIINIANGKVVLEVGTEGIEDYYPCFVSNWNPKAMSA